MEKELSQGYKDYLHSLNEKILQQTFNVAMFNINKPLIRYILLEVPHECNLLSDNGNICVDLFGIEKPDLNFIHFLMTSPLLKHKLEPAKEGLSIAAYSNKPAIVKYLLENKKIKNPPLHLEDEKNGVFINAAQKKALDVVDYLCFDYAIKKRDKEIFKKLMKFSLGYNETLKHIINHPKFIKEWFTPEDILKGANDKDVFKFVIKEYAYNKPENIRDLLIRACNYNGESNTLDYLLSTFKNQYDIHMNDDMIFKKLLKDNKRETIKQLIHEGIDLTSELKKVIKKDVEIQDWIKKREFNEQLENKLSISTKTKFKKI